MKKAATFVILVAATAIYAVNQRRDPTTTAPRRAEYPPFPKTEAEKRILATLDATTTAGELYENVPVADGRMLRLLAESVDARNVIEIGTSTGLSALWICMALDKTGGKLTTFELDPHRAALAPRTF